MTAFQEGDGGAWVVDEATDEVYGHIVGSDSLDGLAYVVPIDDNLADIKRQLSLDFVDLFVDGLPVVEADTT